MARTRRAAALSVIRGLLCAVAATLVLMAVLAALVVYAGLSDGLLRGLNQVVKAAAVLLGTLAAVGVGGERGFLTGALLGMLYMILGYGLCLALGGAAFAASDMLGEILLGSAFGGIVGSVLANLPARRGAMSRA